MSPIHFLSKSRGTRNLSSRIITVLGRFGISSKKYNNLLKRYSNVARNLGFVPTFPITAVILKRHPEIVRDLYQQGVQFAIHGYIHIDYGVLSLEEQVKHFKKAIDTFKGSQVPFTGFRAPFLRINEKTPKALSNLGFCYDSSFALCWEVIDEEKYPRDSWIEYERVLQFYKSRWGANYLSLPRLLDGLVEIPVSIPDDEAIVERLGITDEKVISEIWRNILGDSYQKGELFTLQLHPERIPYCENALADVIQEAKRLRPMVWVTTLGEIAEWWQEKDGFSFKIDSQVDGRYRVRADCSERATVLLKNGKVNVDVDEWFDGYQSVASRDFLLESPGRPVIGLGSDASPDAIKFLKSEGYIVEQNEQSDNYSLYLGNLAQFDEASERLLSRQIESSGAPILRYWRWPGKSRSALSITGDIDSITLTDFLLRIIENSFENWQQRLRKKP